MPKGMPGIGEKAAHETDSELAEEEAKLLLRARTDVAALKPQIADKAAFEKLVQAVQESSARNESAAEFQSRIKALGEGVVKVAKTAASLVA